MQIQDLKSKELSRLLFDGPYFFYKDSDGRIISSDFPFVVEEMIANGAVRVLIPDLGIPKNVLKHTPKELKNNMTTPIGLDFLPSPLRKRVEVIKSSEVMANCRAILSPVCDELGIKFPVPYAFAYQIKKNNPKEVNEAFQHLIRLPTLLLGLKYHSHIFLDVKEMKDSITLLRDHCRNPMARSHLACISGVISTYEPISVGSVKSVSMAGRPTIDAFEKFVTDATFQSISSHHYLLGFPDKAKESGQRLQGLFKRLLTAPQFRALFNYTLKLISVATSLPSPTAELDKALLMGNYLPPALPVAAWLEISRNAVAHWKDKQ